MTRVWLQNLVAHGAIMQQAQSWEIPGYYVKDRTAPVRGYDWYGSYEHVRNIDQRYVDELEGNYTFSHPKHQNLVSDRKTSSTKCSKTSGNPRAISDSRGSAGLQEQCRSLRLVLLCKAVLDRTRR